MEPLSLYLIMNKWPFKCYWTIFFSETEKITHFVVGGIPCEATLRISGSMITSGSAWLVSPLASAFLVSPQRLDPPCMLGMFRTATPSRDRLLRSRGTPQHWGQNICQVWAQLWKRAAGTFPETKPKTAVSSDAALSPRLLGFRSAFCRKQR